MKKIKNYSLTGLQGKIISKIERFHGAFEATKFQRPALIESLKKSSIITSSGASTRIEGAILADEQVKELVDKGCKITSLSSRSEREVAGYIKALNYIYEHFGEIKFSEKTIREIHQILTSELTEDQLPAKQRGLYKDVTNDVVEKDILTGKIIKVWFKTTAPGPVTESAMNNLISEYNVIKSEEETLPLILISVFIVHFLAIHPFRDGNGRLSRLLTLLLLLQHGYKWAQYTSHEKVIEDSKENYYVCLRETQATLENDVPTYGAWIDFFLKTVLAQTEFLNGKIIKESPITVMNKNEKLVYQIIETVNECRISYILENIKMSREGLKDLLKRLVDKGLIQKKGQGKGTTYLIS